MAKENILNTLVKCFSALELLSESNSSYNLSKLANTLKISIGSAQRITGTLIQLGYLMKDSETKTFQLTPKWIRIGLEALNNLDIYKVAYSHLRELNEITKETTSMGILYEGSVMIIERFHAEHVLIANIKAGDRRPVYSNSIGKVILAFQKEDTLKSLINQIKFSRFTSNTIINEKKLLSELKKIREKGYSINNEESVQDVCALAVPILNTNNIAEAGISIVMPKSRYIQPNVKEKYLAALIEKGHQISRATMITERHKPFFRSV